MIHNFLIEQSKRFPLINNEIEKNGVLKIKKQNLDLFSFIAKTIISQQISDHTGFVTSSAQLTVNSPAIQLKFAVPMQYGFDGDNPSVEKKTGGDIVCDNRGFQLVQSLKQSEV